MKTIRRPISILLAVLMVVGMFTMVPISAGAAATNYYIIGSMNGWNEDDTTYELTANPSFAGEYLYTGLTVDANTQLKVIDNDKVYYPNGDNFKLDAAGSYDIYFRPAGGGGDQWLQGTIYAEPHYEAHIGDTKYATLAAAIEAAQAGDTIALYDNVTLTEALVIPADKDFTLDLNGKDITGNVNDKLVQNNGTVVVDDSTAAPGHIYNTNIDKQGNAAFVNYGTATVKNGYFGDKNSDQTDANDVNRGAGFQNQGTAVIDGGYFTACDNFTNTAGTGSGYAYAIINYGTLTINDATVYGKNNGNLANNEGTMTVNGGNFSLVKGVKKNYYSIYNGSDNAHSVVNSGTFTNTTGTALTHTGVGTTELNGGSFTYKKFEQSTTGHPTVSGGTFNKAVPEDYCAEGYLPVSNTDGTYTVGGPYVAKIGSTGYATLADAIAAANDDDTITLMADVTEIATISGKTLTLDLYGFNITSTSKKAPVRAENGAKLTIVNSNADKAENTATQNAIMGPTGSNNYGSVSANGEGTTVDIYAGYYYGYNGNKTAVNAINGATVTFWGGTVNGAAGIGDTTAGKEGKVFYSGVSNPTKPYATSPGTIIVHGGNFSGRMSDSNWGNYVIDGGTFDRNEVVLNENPVDEEGNRVATASSSMTSIGTGTLAEAGWLADGYKVVANGDGTYGVAPKVYVAQIGTTKYETLEAAFAEAQDGDTITLLADCAGNGIKVTPAGKFATGLTVDFDGHTYTVDGETVGSPGTETLAFQLLKNNKVTFQNGAIYSEKAKMLVQNYCDLTLDNMTLTLNNTSYDGAYTLSNNNGSAVIKDTTINANPTDGSFAFDVCRYSSYPSVDVTVTGTSKINGDVEISASKGQAKDGFSLTLESGTMTGDIVLDASAETAMNAAPEKVSVTKAAGFDQEAPEGYMWVDTATEGVQTIAKAVAQIGETKYATLEAAFAAAVDGDTITLLADCAGNGIKVTPAGKFATGLTVDFDGHTYTVDGETVGSPGTETLAFQLLKDNKVTFQNGTIYSEKAKMLVQNYCDLTLDNMTLTLNNTSYNGAYTLSNNNGSAVIKDTTINANPTDGSFAFDVCRYSSYPSVDVTVTGTSKINGDVEIYASKGQAKDGFSLTLESGTMTGDIIVDPTAAAAMEKAPDKASVNKKNTFEQDPAAGYKWKDNGDGTSTLVKIPKLFTGHNITLRGDVSLNFFINTKAIENYDSSVPAKVVFTYDGTRTAEVAFADATPASDGVIVATIQVPAAFMAHQIKAVVYYDGEAQAETDEYSIQQYAETLIADPAAYGIPAAKVEAVKTLMKEMLNYGAKAQTVFAGQVKEQAAYDDLTEKYDYHMASVTDADIQAAIDAAPQNAGKTATDLSTVKPEANATFYTTSVVFLSESTLKIVFKVPGGSSIAGQYGGSQKNTYYWVQEKDIAAAQLDTLQTFTVGDATFNYSVLDYAKVVLKNGNAAAKDLVSALYLYNQAANGYFGANA